MMESVKKQGVISCQAQVTNMWLAFLCDRNFLSHNALCEDRTAAVMKLSQAENPAYRILLHIERFSYIINIIM